MWRQDRRRYHSPLRTLTWPHVVNCQFSCLLISALTTRPNIKHHTCSWNTDCRRKQENWENKRDRTLRYSELRWNQRNTERVEENSRMFWNCPGKMLRLPSWELPRLRSYLDESLDIRDPRSTGYVGSCSTPLEILHISAKYLTHIIMPLGPVTLVILNVILPKI